VAEWVAGLPVWWANLITLVLFVGIAACVFLVPRASFMHDAPDRSLWRDIRWWALGLVAAQLGIYALFS
jgi:hypothetical protein